MNLVERRSARVVETVARVRAIERAGVARDGTVTRDTLKAIRKVLIELAGETELFPVEEFAPPGDSDRLYRLSEDPDHRFALYAVSARRRKATPPHNHTTWAVVVGIRGEERNRFYRRVDDGATPGRGAVEEIDGAVVAPGTGVTLLPDDIHSIHIDGAEPGLFLHMYGRGLEQLSERVYFDRETGDCKVYPSHPDIRDAARA